MLSAPDFFSLEEIDEVVSAIRRRTDFEPRVALILGSGLGGVAEEVDAAAVLATAELPHWPRPTVEGHAGRLIFGSLQGQKVVILQGRAHFYEGYTMAQVTLPIRVMQRLGVEILIVTNAAGAVNPDFVPGDLMLITDHINFVGMAGFNPLRGPNLDELGPRFPDMSQAYDRELQGLALASAEEAYVPMHKGVYAGVAGPSFETPAEVRFLRAVGADAVGMSTVPEVVVARHGSIRVLGISGISNKANLDGNTPTSHEEVLEAGRVLVPRLEAVLRGVLSRL